jgi:TonB family protein
MNVEAAEPHSLPNPPPAAGWSWKKIYFVILIAFAAHLAFVFLLGTKKIVPLRAVNNVPVFRLANPADEFIALTDPTLFVLPHRNDFAAIWLRTSANASPSFQWKEAPSFLPINTASLGATFTAFMQTNFFAAAQLNFKPEPQLIPPQTSVPAVLPQNSAWQIVGEIAGRKILSAISAPALAVNDVIAPSRVQLLVDKNGDVVSVVLLETSGYDPADQTALALARSLRFVPAEKLMFGEILFNWQTVPTSAP